MKKLEYWLRWIAVLPGALIIAFAATFVLHAILYFTLAHGETISGVNIVPIEYNLYPFVIAFTFILAGCEIAPKYKFKTAIVLFGIYIATWITLSFMSFFGANFYDLKLEFSTRTILALLGAIIGLYSAKKANNETQKHD